MKRLLIFPFVFFGCNGLAQLNTITTSLPALGLNADAHLNGTAGIGSVSDDHSIQGAFNGNPAILANGSKYVSATLNHTPWFRRLVPSISNNSVQFAFGISNRYALGFQLKYFTLGNIRFTDQFGNVTSQFAPSETSFQINQAFKVSRNWSIGAAFKLASAKYSSNSNSVVFAVDLGTQYLKKFVERENLKTSIRWGAGITNLGNKAVFDYPGGSSSNFIPITLQTGVMLSAHTKAGSGWLVNNFSYQASKFLVPTPPRYKIDPATRGALRDGNGELIVSSGRDPNVPVMQGVVQSFYDAPGMNGGYNVSGDWEATTGQKIKEEWNELIHHFAHEIRVEFSKNFALKMREGLFLQANSKGGRKYFSFAPGIELFGFRFDYSRWVTLGPNSALSGTNSFSLGYHRSFG